MRSFAEVALLLLLVLVRRILFSFRMLLGNKMCVAREDE